MLVHGRDYQRKISRSVDTTLSVGWVVVDISLLKGVGEKGKRRCGRRRLSKQEGLVRAEIDGILDTDRRTLLDSMQYRSLYKYDHKSVTEASISNAIPEYAVWSKTLIHYTP